MTTNAVYRLILIGAGVSAVPAGIAGVRPIEVPVDPAVSSVPVVAESSSVPAADSLAQVIVDRDLFRLTRIPAEMAYNPAPPEATPAETSPPKPQLILTGIIWGVDPAAIVEGLPGVEGGRLLRAGEASGGIRVRRITQQEVTLAGIDTSWVLQVRKPW